MDLNIVMAVVSSLISLYIVSIIIILILENREPDKTIAWLLVFALFPILGLVVYFYLGQNWKKKNFIRNFRTREIGQFLKRCIDRTYSENFKSESLGDSPLKNKIREFVEKTVSFPIATRNSVKIFTNAEEKYAELKAALENAKEYIHIEYFTIRDDKIGMEIKEILEERAREGIDVMALFDFMGSWQFMIKHRKSMQKAGIKIRSFFNPFFLFAHHKLNYRNHRKIAIIDGEKAFLGGMNIGEEYLGRKRLGDWKDLHFMIEGNVINQLQTIFLYDWYLETKKIAMKKEYYPNLKADNSKKTRLQTVYSGPETEWETIKQTYFMMITNAKKNVWIYTPYFIPDESLSMALKNAALAGVDVKIIVPSRPDHIVPFHASRTYFGELLKAGAKIYEYLPGFIHSKAVMIDGIIANAGTANFDIRSFNVNFDVNLIFYDDDIVNKIEADFQKSLKQSKEITYEEFTKRKISTKFKQSLARLFSPIL